MHPRALTGTWEDYDSLFYNGWLDVSIEPTRFIDQATVRRLGMESDLTDMIRQLGLGPMATHPYDLHFSLVRQFMATAQLTYSNPRARVAGDGILSFLARSVRARSPSAVGLPHQQRSDSSEASTRPARILISPHISIPYLYALFSFYFSVYGFVFQTILFFCMP
ncbi:hypothetical protein Bca4012_083962 [Brassica carinata]